MPVAGGNVSSGPSSPAISHSLLNDLWLRNGMSAWWFPARICNCWSQFMQMNAESGSADPNCSSCLGKGYLYPDRYTVDGVLFSNMQRHTVWSEAGLTFAGRCLLSIADLPATRTMYDQLGYRDVVIPIDFTLEAPIQVQKGKDLLPYQPVEIFYVNYGSVAYNPGTDFQVQGRQIVWVGNQPPANSYYLVRFSFHPVYKVINALATLRNYAHERFPRSYELEEDPSLGDYVLNASPV
jgi:hypothetical protein